MMQKSIDGSEAYKIEACKGYGCIPAKFMFVGISAGKLGALKTEVPFTKDMSGRLFQRVLYHIGLSKTPDEKTLKPELVDCYVTNLVKGRILDECGNNRLPNNDEIAFWMHTLYSEVGKVQPRYVIALGELVYQALWEAQPRINASIIKLKHPRAYGSRGAIALNKAWDEMLADYQKIKLLTVV